jgi:hypothetical protein
MRTLTSFKLPTVGTHRVAVVLSPVPDVASGAFTSGAYTAEDLVQVHTESSGTCAGSYLVQ